MNIKEYYSSLKNVYFNQLVIIGVSATICIFIMIYFEITIFHKLIFISIGTFLVYFYSKYCYFSYRESKASSLLNSQEKVLQHNQFLLLQETNPSFQLKLFKSNGICEWEISEVKKGSMMKTKYRSHLFELKKRDGSTLALFKIPRFQKSVLEIIASDKKMRLNFVTKGKGKEIFSLNQQQFSIDKNSSIIQLLKDGTVLMKSEIGLMPLNWQKQFAPNTPIIEINEKVELLDFYIAVCLLIYCLQKYKKL
ncbi:hypothetical protein MXL46_01540 [Heyndrickxia sporothermodurans]|uniref:hypothetical protein n=1 Tax=Heyndrickxia sporothermodurans TaxID=46224 RepID=UPI002DBBC086|nr:hypothetical protein [Heyndrickxia sporothermodurans]MEB6547788.1 hypothetical protein [Heyndrickxia sporothermodurans]MED3656126.1 hypothetical protein [Heyndrickxia sporothermodurans]MED3781626.1 hypothetical protein [Heyndrickxia sporothermodurans]